MPLGCLASLIGFRGAGVVVPADVARITIGHSLEDWRNDAKATGLGLPKVSVRISSRKWRLEVLKARRRGIVVLQ